MLTIKQIAKAQAAGVRLDVLVGGPAWTRPEPKEVATVIAMIEDYTRDEIAQMLGYSMGSTNHPIHRIISGERTIPYGSWCILCDLAGFGKIWQIKAPDLIRELERINADLDACDEILAEEIEYDAAFYDEIHAEIKALIKRAVQIKACLVKNFGVIAC